LGRTFNGGWGVGDNRFTSGAVTGHPRQTQRGDHKYDGGTGGGLAQKSRGSGAAKQGLARSASESGPHIRSFARLEQNNHDQRDTNDNVNNN